MRRTSGWRREGVRAEGVPAASSDPGDCIGARGPLIAPRGRAEETFVLAIELTRPLVPYLKCCASSVQFLDEHSFPGCKQSKLLLILKRTQGCEGTEMMMEG